MFPSKRRRRSVDHPVHARDRRRTLVNVFRDAQLSVQLGLRSTGFVGLSHLLAISTKSRPTDLIFDRISLILPLINHHHHHVPASGPHLFLGRGSWFSPFRCRRINHSFQLFHHWAPYSLPIS